MNIDTDWIETMGERSEYLHDLVDNASVTAGKQGSVGDGRPMTGWHSDLIDIDSMVDYIQLGGQGGTHNKLVIVIGQDAKVVEAVVKRLQDESGDGVPCTGPAT